jgi:hypothetical protein
MRPLIHNMEGFPFQRRLFLQVCMQFVARGTFGKKIDVY